MKRLLLSLALLSSTAIAFAHGGLTHVMGVVAAASATTLDVKTTDGKLATVALDPSTKWMKGTSSITEGDVHTGDRVVIHAKPVNGKLIAVEVAVGAAKH